MPWWPVSDARLGARWHCSHWLIIRPPRRGRRTLCRRILYGSRCQGTLPNRGADRIILPCPHMIRRALTEASPTRQGHVLASEISVSVAASAHLPVAWPPSQSRTRWTPISCVPGQLGPVQVAQPLGSSRRPRLLPRCRFQPRPSGQGQRPPWRWRKQDLIDSDSGHAPGVPTEDLGE